MTRRNANALTGQTILVAALLAVALLSGAGCVSTPTREGSGGYLDDGVIAGKVQAAILQDAALKSAGIKVETINGVVRLSGVVNSAADIRRAIALANGIHGVVSVKNALEVR